MSRQTIRRQSLGYATVSGVTWLLAGNLSARVFGMVSLYVTGRVLSKEDFALYAIAIAWGEIFGFLTNGGMQKILIQRGRSFHALYPYILTMSLAINCTWLAVLVGLAPVIADSYGTAEIRWLIMVIALSIPTSTIAWIFKAKLSVELRFLELSILSVLSALVRNGGIISLALLSFGPMSFAIPLVLVAAFESTYLFFRTGFIIRVRLPSRRLARMLAHQSVWIMFGMLALALGQNGDYIIIGVLEKNKDILGIYFFGFQLSLAIFTMFFASMRTVLTPSFATLNTDRPQQDAFFLRSLELNAFLMSFLSLGLLVIAEPAVTWVWMGKWDEAVPVIQIIAAAAPARVTGASGGALLEARGRWGQSAMMGWINATGLMAAAAIGAIIGGVLAIAIAVGISMLIRAIIYLFVIWRNIDASWVATARALFEPYFISIVAAACSLAFCTIVTLESHALFEVSLCGASYVVSFALFMWLAKRKLLFEVLIRSRELLNLR